MARLAGSGEILEFVSIPAVREMNINLGHGRLGFLLNK